MTPTPLRTLRITDVLFAAAEACCRDQPARAALISVDENIVPGIRAEVLARAVTSDSSGGAVATAPGRSFVMRWVDHPPEAIACALKHLLEAGHAGAAFLPVPGSAAPARGFVRSGADGLNWLDFIDVVGPGMQRLCTSIADDDRGGSAQPGCHGLARLRIAIVGAELASHVGLELLHLGATRLGLLDDGRLVDLGALGLMAGVGPEAIGKFRVDAVADGLRETWPIDVESHAAETNRIGHALTQIDPDVVVGCETDYLRRAAVQAWCADRLRMLVEVAPDDPWLRRDGRAGATVRVHAPDTPSSAALPADAPMPDHFDDKPMPNAGAWLDNLGRPDLALRLALYQRAARAAAASLADIVRGSRPADLRVRVAQRGDGRMIGSVTETPTCDNAPVPAEATPPRRNQGAVIAGL